MNMETVDDRRSSRRRFCGTLTAAAIATLLPSRARGAEQHHEGSSTRPGESVGAEEALRRLLEGNRRFANGEARHPHESPDWRQSLDAGQHPFAVILGCADSRVCPELLFDQGLGDLFVIRNAGNIVDIDVTASIEYAVDHLHVQLLVVLGHSKCGAVTATLDHLADSVSEPDEVVSLLNRIELALAELPRNLPRDEQISRGVEMNVKHAARRLAEVPDLRKRLKDGKLRIVGAVFDIRTGKVEVLDT